MRDSERASGRISLRLAAAAAFLAGLTLVGGGLRVFVYDLREQQCDYVRRTDARIEAAEGAEGKAPRQAKDGCAVHEAQREVNRGDNA